MDLSSLNPLEPAAVVAYDIEAPGDETFPALDRYSHALVVIRSGAPVLAARVVEVVDGRLAPAQLAAGIRELAWPIWQIENRPRRKPGGDKCATVAICTRDRTDLLKNCLDSLSPLAGTGHEIIVVDNCPSDSRTRELVATYAGVRYVLEPRPGEGIARNRALREARRDFVAFTDDDARVDPFWVDALLENFDDPMVALVTGITMPLELETESQIWFERIHGFSRGYKWMASDFHSMSPLAVGRLGASVNMAVRRSVVDEVGYFDEALGTGTLAQCGTDHEFFYRVLASGYRAIYDPAALVWHRHRREWRSLRSTMKGYGIGVFAWWTRAFLKERELALLSAGPRYLFGTLFKRVIQSLIPGAHSIPGDLAAAEFLGALAGPVAYLRSRRALYRSLRNTGPAVREVVSG